MGRATTKERFSTGSRCPEKVQSAKAVGFSMLMWSIHAFSTELFTLRCGIHFPRVRTARTLLGMNGNREGLTVAVVYDRRICRNKHFRRSIDGSRIDYALFAFRPAMIFSRVIGCSRIRTPHAL